METKNNPGAFDGLEHAARVAKRPTFEAISMELAFALSSRSTCRRLAVGCVITSTDHRKVLSVGYNGNATGLDNDCDGHEPGKCGCLHAEENAVINADVPRSVEKFVYCTNEPCVLCAKRLINLGGVRRVMFVEPYRLGARATLARAGIKAFQMDPITPENRSVWGHRGVWW
jgi:dCMP deaminase